MSDNDNAAAAAVIRAWRGEQLLRTWLSHRSVLKDESNQVDKLWDETLRFLSGTGAATSAPSSPLSLPPETPPGADETEQFIAEVRAELIRARTKFPGRRLMTVALAEEFGELSKAMLDEPAANVRKEAVQTAVMAARVALDGDESVDAWREAKGLDRVPNAYDIFGDGGVYGGST